MDKIIELSPEQQEHLKQDVANRYVKAILLMEEVLAVIPPSSDSYIKAKDLYKDLVDNYLKSS